MRGQPEGWPQNYRLLLDRRFGVPHTPHGTDGRTRTSAFLADRPAARPVELHQYVLQRVVGLAIAAQPSLVVPCQPPGAGGWARTTISASNECWPLCQIELPRHRPLASRATSQGKKRKARKECRLGTKPRGADGGGRTLALLITNQALCQLSYTSVYVLLYAD